MEDRYNYDFPYLEDFLVYLFSRIFYIILNKNSIFYVKNLRTVPKIPARRDFKDRPLFPVICKNT